MKSYRTIISNNLGLYLFLAGMLLVGLFLIFNARTFASRYPVVNSGPRVPVRHVLLADRQGILLQYIRVSWCYEQYGYHSVITHRHDVPVGRFRREIIRREEHLYPMYWVCSSPVKGTFSWPNVRANVPEATQYEFLDRYGNEIRVR